ncbi:MAG TPA: hydrogenase maturation nickel metallochaperone HypA [Patescibacteria group bacterium]|nr:hydrogenase maturation nickel metallochaperone HypA [Patescibacteria group bacterium]
MHELSIAQGILDIALKTAAEHQAVRVGRITVTVGEMTGLVPDSLRQGFEVLAAGTLAAGAELVIDRIPLAASCRECGREFLVENRHFYCPECGSAGVELVAGRELRVEHMEVE